jgi:hypothetical protein
MVGDLLSGRYPDVVTSVGGIGRFRSNVGGEFKTAGQKELDISGLRVT